MQGDAAEHERGLAEFVSEARRSRFSASLAKGGKARAKETARLHDRPELDERWVRPPFEQAAGDEHLLQIVRAVVAHAPNAREAYLVSGDQDLDGHVMELHEGLQAATWATEGTLLSIVPGRVAIYMGELADSARLLVRHTGP
ncbi:MAG: hypothetical protein Q7T55_03550 [Solirubrobacteraceae bacterium]|nr:hypothetical protein [Solirubrobacteraceae bacterium]